MQVKEIMSKSCETIKPDATLWEAAQKMQTLDIGSLPVRQGKKIIGIVTDRDITVRAVSKGWDPKTVHVSKIMTRQVRSCHTEQSLEEAAKIMEQEQLHRLLVLDSHNHPVGMLSLSDFAVKNSDEHLTWEVLENISEPSYMHH